MKTALLGGALLDLPASGDGVHSHRDGVCAAVWEGVEAGVDEDDVADIGGRCHIGTHAGDDVEGGAPVVASQQHGNHRGEVASQRRLDGGRGGLAAGASEVVVV